MTMHIPLHRSAQWGPHHGPHGPMGPDWVARNGLEPWSSTAGTGFELLVPIIWAILLLVVLVGLVYLLGTRKRGSTSDRTTTSMRDRGVRGVRETNRSSR